MGYPQQYECSLSLKNGQEIFLRPIRESDRDLLLDLFGRISPRSLYQRFLTRLHSLPENLLYHFTHVDYAGRFALLATIEEEGRESVIGVARYAHDPENRMTDLAIAVRDDWQGLGLGKSMLGRLVDIGREHGISRFGSMMDPGNHVIEHILESLGYHVSYSLRNGFYQVEILV